MPRRSSAVPVAEVLVRTLAPDQQEVEPDENLLYRAVPQLEGKPPFKVKYEWITPAKADEMLKKATMEGAFRQRPLSLAEIRRWKNLITTKRFVHMLPAGAICVDPEGILINGQHRFHGVASSGQSCGFMMIYDVPRWMFSFFDTNRVRTAKDVFHIGGRLQGPQTPSAMKLAMRYEEFLQGKRAGTGWRHWPLNKDEHADLDLYYSKRAELQDWYATGEKLRAKARLLIPSVMVFRFFQSLAWPGGDLAVDDFLKLLLEPRKLPPTHPARMLAQWASRSWETKESLLAKREIHLMLLMRTFGQVQNSSRIDVLSWAYGHPMAMPYHPKGHEVAVKNVRLELDDLDRADT